MVSTILKQNLYTCPFISDLYIYIRIYCSGRIKCMFMRFFMGFALLFCLITLSVSMRASHATNILCPIQALHQLGDSTSDTGNLVRVLPVGPTLPAARLPYGETFPGRPTGRWSDGRLIIDYTAIALGLPLLNPYLDKNVSFANGVNFAVAGATALSSSFLASRGVIVPPTVGSLDLQLTLFQTYLASICSTPSGCSDKLRRALILVGEIGGNDINYGLAQGKSLDEIRAYVPSIIQAIINVTREIIRDGAVRVIVPGNFPIGCFPANLAYGGNDSRNYDEFGCVKSLNDLAIYQNTNLQTALYDLRREFPRVAIIYADYYNALLSLIRAPSLYGFNRTTILEPCCRSREYSILSPGFCGNPGVPVCPNPQQYIHWDGFHLTQEAHRRITQITTPNILTAFICLA